MFFKKSDETKNEEALKKTHKIIDAKMGELKENNPIEKKPRDPLEEKTETTDSEPEKTKSEKETSGEENEKTDQPVVKTPDKSQDPISADEVIFSIKEKQQKFDTFVALYKQTPESNWILYPQMFISEDQATKKLDLMSDPNEIHLAKIDLPE